MKISITTTHHRGDELVRRALENYANVQVTLVATTTHRKLHNGETEEDRQRLIGTYTARETAATDMAKSITTEP